MAMKVKFVGLFLCLCGLLYAYLAYASDAPYIVQRTCQDSDALISSTRISSSGMLAQGARLKVISQNIANASVTGLTSDQDPYRRKIIFFKNEFDPKARTEMLQVEKIANDESDFVLKYQPYHPAADKNGYVKYPNVNIVVETADAKEAQRSFEANVHAFELARTNQSRVIDLMK
ncbi:flagellar basal-body rod protein FlgC [Alphaproteobacteria bacterium]